MLFVLVIAYFEGNLGLIAQVSFQKHDETARTKSKSQLSGQVVYTMGPRPPFSKHVLPKVKTMTNRRSVRAISRNFSLHLLVLECYFFHLIFFK